MDNILNLSSRELRLLGKLSIIAEEAHEASQLISTKFQKMFGIGSKEILVFTTSQNDEYYGEGYLNIDGTFRYVDNWWGGREWTVNVNEQSIYEMYKAELLKQLDDEDEIDYRLFTANENEISMAALAPFFRTFVDSLSTK